MLAQELLLQTQPPLWEVRGIDTGDLSGVTPSWAVSWGKVKPDELKHAVMLYAHTTLVFPIIASYALGEAKPRPRKESYAKRTETVPGLRAVFLANQ